MTSRTITSEDARARAEQRFQKASQREREAEAAQKADADQRKAVNAKVDRLRAMRLAKEATAATPLQAEADALAKQQRADLLGIAKPAPRAKAAPRKRKSAAEATEAENDRYSDAD
ncbi:hypothetical protein [Ferrovibrio terrae]|uniref:hypothetical protein n=1 Tax=Ferrovibrio terrae TaxID=2594003 RepID=UPI0031383067